MGLYNINFFIKKIKEIEKLNISHKNYISLINEFNIYLENDYSIKELCDKLGNKSSCIPYLLQKIFFKNKNEIFNIINKINNHFINNNYNINDITNYLVNILSNNITKNQFILGLKNKDLYLDTIFSNLLDERFEKYTKYEVNNKNVVDNIFYKIIKTPKHFKILINCLEFKNYDLFTKKNDFLKKKDIFYKNLLIILIELFTKKYSFYIYDIEKYRKNDSFLIFKKIFKLIKYTFNDILEEFNNLNNNDLNFNIITEDREERIKNILEILNNKYLLKYNKNFFETSLIFLVKMKEKSGDNEDFIKILYNYYINNINNVLISKNIYILVSNIINFDISNDYNLIIDYFYLINKLLSKENHTRFSKYYFYISKIVNNTFKSFSLIYDKIKDENYLVFDLIIEICKFLNITLLKFNNYRRLFCNIQSNIFNFKKFCCVFLENILFNIEIFKNSLKTNNTKYAKFYFNCLKIMFTTLQYFTKYYSNIIFCNELKKLYNQVIEYFINNINEIYNQNNLMLKENIISIFISIKESIFELDNIDFFNNIDFSNLKIKLLEENKININQLVFFNKSKKIIVQNYDEKFCDPITNNLIEEPIMIPQNIIVDKNMIYRYLLTNNTNPYNRCKLNIEILNKYNENIEVRNKLNKFSIELKNYKKTL